MKPGVFLAPVFRSLMKLELFKPGQGLRVAYPPTLSTIALELAIDDITVVLAATSKLAIEPRVLSPVWFIPLLQCRFTIYAQPVC